MIAFACSRPGTVVVTAGEANGAPRVAWGDSFFYDPHDDPARERFAELVGWSPAEHAARGHRGPRRPRR